MEFSETYRVRWPFSTVEGSVVVLLGSEDTFGTCVLDVA